MKGKIGLACIDEAHCVLAWGKSKFRPSYLQLRSLNAIIPGLKMIAMTATAKPKSVEEISSLLLMDKYSVVALPPDR